MPIRYSPMPLKKWAIPSKHLFQIIEKENQTRKKSKYSTTLYIDYDSICLWLEELGFECLKHHQTHRISSFSFRKDLQRDPDDFDLYYHPKGFLINMNSYTHGGYFDDKNSFVPKTKTLNDFRLTAQIDAGFFHQNSNLYFNKLSASDIQQNFEYHPSGTELIHTSVKGANHSIFQSIAEIQSYGKVIPCSEWKNRNFFYIDKELYTNFDSEEQKMAQGKDERDIEKMFADKFKQSYQNMIQSFPDQVRFFLEDYSFAFHQRVKQTPAQEEEVRKNRLKETLLRAVCSWCSRGENRWAEPHQESWLNLAFEACFENPEIISQSTLNTLLYENPTGFSFGHVLLTVVPQYFEQWLNIIPTEIVQNWVELPILNGFTLIDKLIWTKGGNNRNSGFAFAYYLNNKPQEYQKIYPHWLAQSFTALKEKVGIASIQKGQEHSRFSLWGLLYLLFEENDDRLFYQQQAHIQKNKSFFNELQCLHQEGFKISERFCLEQFDCSDSKKHIDIFKKIDIPFGDGIQLPHFDLFYNQPLVSDLMVLLGKEKLEEMLPTSTNHFSKNRL